MKKSILLIVGLLANAVFAQTPTFVSTNSFNRNVILEIFTGTTCGYCPDADLKANSLSLLHPNRMWAVNIHSGGYSNGTPNFKTTDGTLIHDSFDDITGYPTGTVNRGNVSGRGDWEAQVQNVLNTSSHVNIAAQGSLNWNTRTLTLTVEAYYTGNSSIQKNFVTVAMIQNDIEASQTNYGPYNPTQILGNGNYNHMHALRDIISPTWGDTVHITSQGALYTKTYTYTIPENINNIPLRLNDLDFLVWIAEDKHNIITGNKAEITHINPPKLILKNVIDKGIISCEPKVGLELTVEKYADEAYVVNSIEFQYGVEGETPLFYTWDARPISGLNSDTINLPTLPITPNVNQTISVAISKINNSGVDRAKHPSTSITVIKNHVVGSDNMKFDLTTDRYGSETSWVFFGPSNDTITSGRGYPDLPISGTTLHTHTLSPQKSGCYRLEVLDAYGDGINGGYGAGGFKLYNSKDSIIISNDGKFTSKVVYMIQVEINNGTTSASEYDLMDFSLYPNPVADKLYIQTESEVKRVEIFDTQGKLVKTKLSNTREIEVGDLTKGVYLLHLINERGTSVKKFTKQ